MKLKTQYFNILLVLTIFAEGILAYGQLPQKVATHWNTQGDVDGYMGKFGGAFFIPFLTLGLYLLFLVIPKIDPKKTNLSKFIDIYNKFISVFLIYMIYIYSLSLAFNLGYKFDFTRAIIPGFAVLFYFIGWMLPKAEPNWFVGIRTPWTLSSDKVWAKTHKIGGTLYKISAAIALLGIIFPKFSIYFILIPILATSLYLVVFSYLDYLKK